MKRLSILSILFAFISSFALAAEVNVFSARHYDSDIQLYEKFTAATGIKVNVVSGKDKALQKRITEDWYSTRSGWSSRQESPQRKAASSLNWPMRRDGPTKPA